MARKEKRYHYIYKTTCKITNKFYVGMHSTDNLKDGYTGSGKKIRRSINKHGVENHVVEILEFLPDRSSLKFREAEIVNEQFLQDPLCMNLQLGGGGGFSSEEHREKFIEASNKSRQTEEFKNKMSDILRELWKEDEYRKKHTEFLKTTKRFTGKQHSEDTKQKMRIADRTGDKNSQYGSCWITNGLENKKIKKTEKIPDGWKLGRTILKIKI